MDGTLFTDDEVRALIIYGTAIELAFRRYGNDLKKEAEQLVKGKSIKELRRLMATKIRDTNVSLVDGLTSMKEVRDGA